MAETPATVTIGKKTLTIAPGMGGGEKPDGADVGPGGGAMPLHMY